MRRKHYLYLFLLGLSFIAAANDGVALSESCQESKEALKAIQRQEFLVPYKKRPVFEWQRDYDRQKAKVFLLKGLEKLRDDYLKALQNTQTELPSEQKQLLQQLQEDALALERFEHVGKLMGLATQETSKDPMTKLRAVITSCQQDQSKHDFCQALANPERGLVDAAKSLLRSADEKELFKDFEKDQYHDIELQKTLYGFMRVLEIAHGHQSTEQKQTALKTYYHFLHRGLPKTYFDALEEPVEKLTQQLQLAQAEKNAQKLKQHVENLQKAHQRLAQSTREAFKDGTKELINLTTQSPDKYDQLLQNLSAMIETQGPIKAGKQALWQNYLQTGSAILGQKGKANTLEDFFKKDSSNTLITQIQNQLFTDLNCQNFQDCLKDSRTFSKKLKDKLEDEEEKLAKIEKEIHAIVNHETIKGFEALKERKLKEVLNNCDKATQPLALTSCFEDPNLLQGYTRRFVELNDEVLAELIKNLPPEKQSDPLITDRPPRDPAELLSELSGIADACERSKDVEAIKPTCIVYTKDHRVYKRHRENMENWRERNKKFHLVTLPDEQQIPYPRTSTGGMFMNALGSSLATQWLPFGIQYYQNESYTDYLVEDAKWRKTLFNYYDQQTQYYFDSLESLNFGLSSPVNFAGNFNTFGYGSSSFFGVQSANSTNPALFAFS